MGRTDSPPHFKDMVPKSLWELPENLRAEIRRLEREYSDKLGMVVHMNCLKCGATDLSHYEDHTCRDAEDMDHGGPTLTPPPAYTFQSGGKRSKKHAPLHLIPWSIFQDRLAERYYLGAVVRGYGDGNWERAIEAQDMEFILDAGSHALKHLQTAIENIKRGAVNPDDDLAAVIWGAIALMKAQEVLHVRPDDIPF